MAMMVEKEKIQEREKDLALAEKGFHDDSASSIPPAEGSSSVSSRGGSEREYLDVSSQDKVQRKLNQRHVQMCVPKSKESSLVGTDYWCIAVSLSWSNRIAIAGTIGTGLFLGSGGALSGAGPLGALIAYALVGTVAYSSLCSIGELSTFAPVSGTFPHFASRWVDPAFGFAVGWVYFYSSAISTPVEITAATILITFWDDDPNHMAIYTAVVCVVVCSINIFGVKYFGESEFFFSIIKISMITGLIICGLVIDLGGAPNHERIGFRYWKNPGAIARAGLVDNITTDRFLAIVSVIVQAAFSFQGMELVAIAASETESPRRNIAKAVRRVFYRIILFYICGILIIGMCVASNDPALLQNTGNAAQSPFVIAINRAGIKVLPHIINAGVFTSAFSAGNSYLFCASRVLYGLALRGQAPKIFAYCTKGGLPIVAVLTSGAFGFLAFMNVSSGAETVFNWLVNLSTVAGFFLWWSINITYARFNRGMKKQGRDLTKNVYHNSWQPYISYWGIMWTTVFILINGFEVFFNFTIDEFLTAYINIPIFFALFLGYKIIKRTTFWRSYNMDFETGIPTIEETELPEVTPTTISGKIFAFLF